MGIESMYDGEIQQSIRARLSNPPPDDPPPTFSLFSAAASGFKSVGVGVLQAGANFMDYAAQLQQADTNVVAKSDFSDSEKAARTADLQSRASSFSAGATALRLRAAELAPDPITSHRADQVISGIGSGITKAVGSVGTFGPIAGSALFGAGEADTTFHEAIDSGKDPATATKLAATTGLFSAATAGLPAGGATVAKTVGIAAAAGPGSYMASEAISRKILQNAGYDADAAMHDPTDPLGLALSIALPGAMGALHVRNLPKPAPSIADVARGLESAGHRTAADGSLLTSPKGAQGEMQVMPATQTNPGFGVRPAALGPDGKPTPDEIARVGVDYIAAMQNRYGGDPAKTLAAYNAGPGALDAAVAAHGNDWLAHMPAETQAYVTKGVAQLGDHAISQAAADPDAVDAARVQLAARAFTEHLPDHPSAAGEVLRAADAIASGPVVEAPVDPVRLQLENQLADIETQRAQALADASNLAAPGTIRETRQQLAQHQSQVPDSSDAAVQVRAYEIQALSRDGLLKTAQKQAQQEIDQQVADHAATTQRLQAIIEGNAQAQRATQSLAELDRQHADLTEQLQAIPLQSVRPAPLRPTAAAARDALMAPDSTTLRAPKADPVPGDMFRPVAEPRTQEHVASTADVLPERDARAATGDAAGQPNSATPAGESAEHLQPATQAAPGANSEARGATAGRGSLDAQRADALIADNPDLKVQAVGGTETITASEAMERARAEAAHDLGERDLVRAAIQCALTFGS